MMKSGHDGLAWFGRGIVALAAMLVTALPLRAAQFDIHRGDDLNILVVTDEILPGDDETFMTSLAEATQGGEDALVVLASPGGALGAGMHIGLMIAEAGVPTFVPQDEVCASACALAWLAGAPRMMTAGSEIGFHQPYDERDGEMIPSIEANAVVGHYIATIGMGPEIVSFAVSAPPDRMAWLDAGTALQIGLETIEVASSAAPAIAMPRDVAGFDRRVPPTDEAAGTPAGIPLPVMRDLTAFELVSLEATGTTDGAAVDGRDLPLVTAFTAFADEGHPPFEEHDLRGTDGGISDLAALDAPMIDELVGYDEMEAALEPVGFDVAITGVSMETSNIELAALDAMRRYGLGGTGSLGRASATCWRELRIEPSIRGLQYCHVFDLVGSSMVDPQEPGDFAGFAVEARLREHRDLVGDIVLAGDYAASWRSQADMVVSMMSGR